MLLDYHMHTRFSDGRSELTKYVDEAIRKRIGEIGFSDHIYLQKESWSMDFADLPRYVSSINEVEKTSQISIKKGLEVDFVPNKMDNLMQTISGFDFDYLIGSVHHVGNWLIDSERHLEEWKRRDVDQVYGQYFGLVQEMANTRLFDIVGHLDLAKKFNFRPINDLNDLLLATVKTLAKSGMCIEINTGGLRRTCREIYPSKELLQMCFDNSLPITFGSDAHSPEHVGADFEKAVSLVKEVGYSEIVRFSKRKRSFVPL